MPHSDEQLRPWIRAELERFCDLRSFTKVVDVGAGAGAWLDFLKPSTGQARWVAVEVWGPYVQMFNLDQRYDELILSDARQAELPDADLYIFGDVLEHMPADDAVRLWDRVRHFADWLVINLPVIRYEQGAVMGNPHEVHVHHWDTPSVLASFPGIVSHHDVLPGMGSGVGAFIGKGYGQGL
jgi:hypothetical protein